MRRRLLLGPVLIAAVIALFALDQWVSTLAAPSSLPSFLAQGDRLAPALILTPLALALAALASIELATMLRARGLRADTPVLVVASQLGLLSVSWGSSLIPAHAANAAAVLALILALLSVARARSSDGALANAGSTLLAFTHLGVMLAMLLLLRREHSAWFLLWVVAIIKSCDTFAYFTGKTIGRHKLIPWLSPGKTWEGLVGGIVGSCAMALLAWPILSQTSDRPLWLALPTGILFALAGQAGDLAISLYKRDAQRKDSGHILPGFGGILDLIDSPLLVAPVAVLWFEIILPA